MLGLTDLNRARPNPYRDYAAVVPGDAKYVEMEQAGLVVRKMAASPEQPLDVYATTPSGRDAATEDFYRLRKSRGKRIYSAYLKTRDYDPRLTFMEFLKSDDYEEVRNDARFGREPRM